MSDEQQAEHLAAHTRLTYDEALYLLRRGLTGRQIAFATGLLMRHNMGLEHATLMTLSRFPDADALALGWLALERGAARAWEDHNG